MPRPTPVHPLVLAALAVVAAGATPAVADGPRLPWADPIGVPPTYGTATPSLPYAEPIGASQLNPPSRTRPALPLYPPAPARACYRVRDNRGNVATYCRTLR